MPDIVLNVPNFNNPRCPVVNPPDTVIWADSFNRADVEGLNIGSTPVGLLPWTIVNAGGGGAPVMGISGNKGYVKGFTNTTGARSFATVDPGAVDGVLKAKMIDRGVSVDNANGIYLTPYLADNNNNIFVTPSSAVAPFGITVFKRVANAGTSLVSVATPAVAGDVLEVQRRLVSGVYYVCVFLNGVEVIHNVNVTAVLALSSFTTPGFTKMGFGGYPVATAVGVGGKVNHWDDMSFYQPGEWVAP